MTITINRLKHSLAVATKMKKMATESPNGYSVVPDDAFVLGLLHDIGYEFSQTQREHAHRGGLVLKAQGYRYWREIYYHGIPQEEYDSPMLRLLNYADMTTGPDGEQMTIQARINDIALRYGKESWQEQEAIALAEQIQKR